jgi:hypothetical protein
MGVVALPLAVSVFAAAPAHAGVPVDSADPSKDFSQKVGFILPWLVGLDGIGGSMGTIGGKAFVHSGPSGTQAGVIGILQQSTHVGPAYFHLNVVKSATFTYTPGTTTTPGGHGPCDHGHAATATGPKAELNLVDIGNWAAGIPGFIEWYGELGFTSDTVVDSSGVSFNWKGINKQYVSIGGGLLTLGFDFQPSFSLNVPTPGVNLAAPFGNVLTPGYAPAGGKSGDDGVKPSDDGAKPGHDGAKPGDVVDTAGYDGAKPGQDFEKAGYDAAKPGPGEGPPEEGGDEPGLQGDEPGEGGVKPGHDGDKPGAEGGVKPRHDGDKPGADGVKPGHDGDKPGADGEKPGEGSNNDKPRGGDKPGQNNHDKSGQDGSRPGPGGDGSGQGGEGAAAGGSRDRSAS